MNHQNQLWVELVGDIIVARARGAVTPDVVVECQQRVLQLLKDTGAKKVLYDALEVERPTIEATLTQQALTPKLKEFSVRTAILVANTGVAYLARIAFGEGHHQVFYNDIAQALLWLSDAKPVATAGDGQLEVEMVGDIIVARIQGIVTETGVIECQKRVLQLLNETGSRKILYDALEAEHPTIGATRTQQVFTVKLKESSARTAILVANSEVAYLARIAFGEGDHHVFYNDVSQALRWLASPDGRGTSF